MEVQSNSNTRRGVKLAYGTEKIVETFLSSTLQKQTQKQKRKKERRLCERKNRFENKCFFSCSYKFGLAQNARYHCKMTHIEKAKTVATSLTFFLNFKLACSFISPCKPLCSTHYCLTPRLAPYGTHVYATNNSFLVSF